MWLAPFFRWWIEELAKPLPGLASTAFLGSSASKTLRFSEKANEIKIERRNVIVPLRMLSSSMKRPKVKKGATHVDVVLPEDLVLRRHIEAPRQAKGKLKPLAAIDLRRSTPFTEADAVWALGRPKAEGQMLSVAQYVAKTSDLHPLKRRLAEAGLIVNRFVVDDPDDGTVELQDFSAAVRPNARKWQMVNASLLLVTLGIGAFAFVEPALDARAKASAFEQDLQTLRQETIALRREVEAIKTQRNEAEKLRASLLLRPRLVETIRDVTVALPDAAWASSLVFTPSSVTLSGDTSASAVDLVLELSRNPSFGDPRLSGATTRTRDNRERFEITARPGAEP